MSCPTGDCSFPFVTQVTVENEEIIFTGESSSYINSTTEYLQFDFQSVLNFIPTNLFKYFSNFRGFIAYNTSTTTIVTDAFNHCTLLEVLYIYYSPFEVLPAGFAQTCENLNYIDIQFNLLTFLDRDAFRGLANVKNIFLGYNKITCIPPGLFDNTPYLRTVNFAFNNINALDPMTFANMPYIQDIVLSNCQLSILSNLNLACTGIVSGLNLYLSDNPISAVDPTFLATMFPSRVAGAIGTPMVDFSNITGPFDACMNTILDPTLTPSNYEAANPSFNPCYDHWNAVNAASFKLKCFQPSGSTVVHPMCASTQTTPPSVTISMEESTISATTSLETTQSDVVTQGKLETDLRIYWMFKNVFPQTPAHLTRFAVSISIT